MDPREDSLSAFGGMAGRVAFLAFNPLNLIMGILFGIASFLIGWTFGLIGAPVFGMLLSQCLLALVLARYALNGRAGEWWGSAFSSAGGTVYDAMSVGLRYLVLTALWTLPLVAIGLRPEALLGLVQGGGGVKLLVLLALYILGSIFTPPVFLVVSLRADSVADLFQPPVWKGSFGGRLGDLFVLYAMILGGGTMALLLLAPGVLLAGSSAPKALVVLGLLVVCFLAGYGTDLTGRLAGMFAAGIADPPAETVRIAPSRPGVGAPPLPAPATARPGGTRTVGAGATSRPAPVPAPVPQPAATAAVAPGSVVPPVTVAMPSSGPAVPAAVATAQAVGLANGKVVLLDARQPVSAAWAQFSSDPAGAIATLEALRHGYVPHPHVLQALCLMRAQSGDEAGAVELAREALPLCFQRGHLQLAAQLFRALRARSRELPLSTDQVLQIAHALVELRDWKGAANAFAAVLANEPGDIRALRGTLAVADLMGREAAGIEGARRLYRFLLERAPFSPVAEEARKGLEAAERKLAHASS